MIKESRLATAIGMLSVLMEIGDKRVFVIVVYCVAGLLDNFIEGLIENMNVTWNMRIVVVGDFNLGQMLEVYFEKINQLKSEFNLNQLSNFTTYIAGAILDLVLDNQQSDIVQWKYSSFKYSVKYSSFFTMMI